MTTYSVLVVDDEPDIRQVVSDILQDEGHEVTVAANAVEARTRYADDTPDLVLLDVMMPRMSGFEVCQKLKTNPDTRDIVVIMVTALHEVADYERAVESGTDDFLSKPVNKLELLTRVRSLLRVALLRRRLDDLMGDPGSRGPG